MYKNRGEIETEEGKSKKKKIEKRIKQCILVAKKKKKRRERKLNEIARLRNFARIIS